MEIRCGGLYFMSKFDSGNLAKVEKAPKEAEDGDTGYYQGSEIRADYEFNVWTKPDAAGTSFENGNRSWFYFGVRGGSPGKVIKITIMNLNRQGKLYSQGHAPLVKTVPGKPRWDRVRDRPMHETIDGQFLLTFTHRFLDIRGSTTYFAFCFPWAYTENQEKLSALDDLYQGCDKFTASNGPSDRIYYHREVLCYSLDQLCVDLVTISDCHGLLDKEEERFDSKLFPDHKTARCKVFKNKRVFLVSSRVHPGETPASFVFNGFLDFILRPDDPRAMQLRRQYVFKLIPILNPDGVMRGHYRTDSRGVNLNRMYLDPNFEIYPSIYGAKSLLVYHHVHNKVQPNKKNSSDGKRFESTRSSCDSEPVGKFATEQNHRENIVLDLDHDSTFTEDNESSPVVSHTPRGLHLNNKTYNVVYDNDNARTENSVREELSSQIPCKLQTTLENPENLFDDPGNICNSNDLDVLEESIKSLSESVASLNLAKNSGNFTTENSLLESNMNTNNSKPCVRQVSASEIKAEIDISDDDSSSEAGHIGNEGSDDDDDEGLFLSGEVVHTPHLSDPKLRAIPAHESGIAFYVDLHGHASKRGCFIYGNYFENEDRQVENMLFPKLISLNTAHFDFGGCNFTEKNMYLKDKREGLSKEGSGRVSIFKALGIIHSYTLECNYNTGRMVNSVPPAYGDNGRGTPPPLAGFPPRYTQAHFEEVGKAMAIAALDMTESNPWSRVTLSEFVSLHGLRDWVRRYIRGQKGLSKGMPNRSNKTPSKAFNAGPSPGMPGFVPRVALLAQQRQQQQERDTAPPQPRPVFSRRQSQNSNQRKELAPVRDVPRAIVDRSNRRRSMTTLSSSSCSETRTTSISHMPSTPAVHQIHSAPVSLTHTAPSQKQCNSGKVNPIVRRPSQTINSEPNQHNTGHIDQHICSAGGQNFHPVPPKPASTSTTSARTLYHQQLSRISAGTQPTQVVPPPPSCTRIRQPSGDEVSIHSIEEEKIQQLKNIPNLSMRQKPPNYLSSSKPLEHPKSDPVKRRIKKASPGKRRASSHSPKSAKGLWRAGGNSSTDSDIEKRTKIRRRKNNVKEEIGSIDNVDNAFDNTEHVGEEEPASKELVQIAPRHTIHLGVDMGLCHTPTEPTQLPGPDHPAYRPSKVKKRRNKHIDKKMLRPTTASPGDSCSPDITFQSNDVSALKHCSSNKTQMFWVEF